MISFQRMEKTILMVLLHVCGACRDERVGDERFEALHAPAQQVRRRTRIRDPETILRDLSSLLPGAPVVHVEHGVGRYLGLQRLDAGGVEAEYLVLEYANNGKLYVPVASLNLIHRYTGGEPETAPLHSLGSDRWAKAQARAREKAHDVAADLHLLERDQYHEGEDRVFIVCGNKYNSRG